MLKLLGLSDELRLPLARHPFIIYLFIFYLFYNGWFKVTWDFAYWICLFYHKYSTRLIDIVWFDVLFAELLLNVLYFLQTMQLLMAI